MSAMIGLSFSTFNATPPGVPGLTLDDNLFAAGEQIPRSHGSLAVA
jgi:hypothetical protein